jgi:hypothetical protein
MFSTCLIHLFNICFCFLATNCWIGHLTFFFMGHSYLHLPCASCCISYVSLLSLSQVSLSSLSIYFWLILLQSVFRPCFWPLVAIFSFPLPSWLVCCLQIHLHTQQSINTPSCSPLPAIYRQKSALIPYDTETHQLLGGHTTSWSKIVLSRAPN